MRASRKKMISKFKTKIDVTCNQDVRKRVDEFLTSEYEAWKDTKAPRKHSNGIFTCGSETNNTLIMEYIHFIYNEYSIVDPLTGEKNENDMNENLRSSQRSHRSQKIEITSNNQHKPNSFEVKIIDPELEQYEPNSYPQKNKQEEENQEMVTPFKKIEKSFRETEPKRALYDSREATTHYRENSNIQDTMEKSMHSHSYSLSKNYGESYTPKENRNNPEKGLFKFSNKIQNLTLSRESPISEVYRYCLACENAILDANVETHEANCEEFKKIYEMNLEEILNHITVKINILREKVKSKTNSLTEEDSETMQKAYENMNEACENIMSSGLMSHRFIKNYDKAILIGKKWSEASEYINKLRWFIKVREEIVKKFEA